MISLSLLSLSQVTVFDVNFTCDQSDFLVPNTSNSCSYFEFDFLGESFEIISEWQGHGLDSVQGIVYGSSKICFFENSYFSANPIFFFQTQGSIYGEIIDFDPQLLNLGFCAINDSYSLGDPLGSVPFEELHFDLNSYIGLVIEMGNDLHFGWMKCSWDPLLANSIRIDQIAIENTPNWPIIAGHTSSLNSPINLNLNYSQSPDGLYLNWTTIPNAQACQVRGGTAGGNDPHNFIVSGPPYNQLFINGNSLTMGQEYQWKVRCATGINPFSGVSDWSDYNYFIYQP